MYESGVDIVVVSYKTPAHLAALVDSLIPVLDELPVSLTIVSVEASEADRVLAEELLLQALPRLEAARHLPIADNVGFNRACNRGAEWGYFSTLLFLNADTELRPGVLKTCDDLLWSDPAIGIVGPRQMDKLGRLTAPGIIGTLERPGHRGFLQPDRGQFTDTIDCPTVAGSAYFIKREVFDEMAQCESYQAVDPTSTGAFLTTNHYWGETFLSYHAITHGYRVVFAGGATMIHRWHAASPQGGWAEKNVPADQAFFRKACEAHEPRIPHD